MSQKCTAPITEPRDSDSILISSPFSLYGFRICLDVPYFLPLLPDRSSFGVSSGYQGPTTLVNPRMSGHEIKPFRFVSPMLANSFTQSSVKRTSRFLLLGLVPVLVVHIPGRNYVGGWIPTSPRASSTLFYFWSCGTKVTLISKKTVLERLSMQKDARMGSALCHSEETQTAINRT